MPNIRMLVALFFIILGIGLTVAVFTVAGCQFNHDEAATVAVTTPQFASDIPEESDEPPSPAPDPRLGQAGPAHPAPSDSAEPRGGQPGVAPGESAEHQANHHSAGALVDN